MRRRTRPGQTRCPRPKQKRCAPLPHERLRRPRTCSPGRKPSRNLRVFLREQGSQSAWLRAHDAELALTGGEANQTHSAGSHAAGRSHAAAVGCVYFAAAPNSAPPAPGPSAWSTWSAWHESRPRRSGRENTSPLLKINLWATRAKQGTTRLLELEKRRFRYSRS